MADKLTSFDFSALVGAIRQAHEYMAAQIFKYSYIFDFLGTADQRRKNLEALGFGERKQA